jgi:hypothetical protein
MADEAQIIYEYSVGADVSFKTNDLVECVEKTGW